MRGVTLFDDARATECQNLDPARAATLADFANAITAVATRYRPLFNFWGGSQIVGGAPSVPLFRQSWANISPGSPGLAMSLGCIPSHHQTVTGQGATTTVDGVDAGTHGSWNAQWTELTGVAPGELFEPVASRPDFTRDGTVKEITIGSTTSNGPQVRAGLIFERTNDTPVANVPATTQLIPTDWITPAAPILGQHTSGSNLRSLRGYRDFFRDTYKARRLVFGWSGGFSGSSGPLLISNTSHRYIFDTIYGTGGTTPTPTTPGITVPLRYSAAGRGTTVRLYIRVYAAMNATGATGSLAFFNRSGAGMSGETAMINPIAVTGTTFKWWGCAATTTFSEANDTWFSGNAALPYDRIVLCAKTGIGSNALKLGAFTVHAYYGTR